MSFNGVLGTSVSAEDIMFTDEDDGKRCRNHHLIVIGNGFPAVWRLRLKISLSLGWMS